MSGIKITTLISKNAFTFSFEVTPNISMELLDSLTVDPIFFSVTWHAKSHECKDLDIGPLKLACDLRNRGKNVLLHLSCDLLKSEYLNRLLTFLEEKGICNLFVMLGESYDVNYSDFKNCKELIKYIKNRTGNDFCIGVAGFPDEHGMRLQNLKEKVDIGADFIITQAFFEFSNFKHFVDDCKDVGITVPILPGIFVYETHEELNNFTNVCKVKVSNDLLKHVRNNDPSTGKEIVKKMVLNVMTAGLETNHLHFFTLNKLNRVLKFLKEIDSR